MFRDRNFEKPKVVTYRIYPCIRRSRVYLSLGELWFYQGANTKQKCILSITRHSTHILNLKWTHIPNILNFFNKIQKNCFESISEETSKCRFAKHCNSGLSYKVWSNVPCVLQILSSIVWPLPGLQSFWKFPEICFLDDNAVFFHFQTMEGLCFSTVE